MPRRLWRRFAARSQIWMFLRVLGPGIIAASADNDASGIYGYSLAGAQYQYGMLWVLVLSTLSLAVCQEMCARMGAVTGKGLADLIREEYGVRITAFAMLALLVANFATTVSEFAGILAAIQLFFSPIARIFIIAGVAGGIWMLVARGTYRGLERILLAASVVYLGYIISAFLSRPDWAAVGKTTILPNLRSIGPIGPYIFMVINVVGTTITPWGQFYIQSSVRDKGIQPEEYRYERWDVLAGAFFTNFIAYFIIVAAGATLFASHVDPGKLTDVGSLASALKPLAGPLATAIFAIGLFNASCFGAIAVPISTAYAVTEALGWESGLGRRVREAPLFVGVFTFLVFSSAIVVVLFPHHLSTLIILPNIVGGMLLPIILVLMLLLVNKKRLMGDYVNSWRFNLVAWSTAIIMIALSLVLVGNWIIG